MYATAAVFILAAVGLQGGKMLVREQKDMSILKSVGITSKKLRLGFTLRIGLAALIGSAVGAAVCIISADTLISRIMASFGIGQFISKNGVLFAVVSAVPVSLLFGSFAYIFSRRIKTIPISLLTSKE
jgi:ABC-type lipoprotein release transport system permease subunit